MGYAGYAPAKLPPPKPTEIQAALYKVTDPEVLQILAKLLRNVAISPKEPKYRQIRLSNPKISKSISKETGGLDALLALGWAMSTEKDEEDIAIVPPGRAFTMSDVRVVQDAETRLKKDLLQQKRSSKASKLPSTADQSRIREQMEADRLERLSKLSTQ